MTARIFGQRVLRTLLVLALAAAGLAAGAGAAAAPAGPAGAGEAPRPTGRVVVLLERPRLAVAGSGARAARARARAVARAGARLEAVLARHRLRRSGPALPPLGAVVVEPPAGESLAALRRRLHRDRRVVAVEPEYSRRLRRAPDDPAYGTPDDNAPDRAPAQWNLQRENFAAAWELATGKDVLVAVVDSGADTTHPELAGRISGGKDQDPNQFHSDDAGVDENGHGTWVSGMLCGATNNGAGIASAGFGCRLLIEKINGASISDQQLAAAITDAADQGARIVNMSLGGPGDSSLIERAVGYAVARDAVLVAAAADEPTDDQGVPAKYLQPTGSGADPAAGRGLVVTAAEYDDSRAGFAGFGSQISIAAYGHASDSTAGLFSTFPKATTELETGLAIPPSPPCFCRASFQGDNRYAYLSGTSMAAPQVSGAAALIRGLNPALPAARVVRLLKESARRAAGWEKELGWGILDAGKALAAAQEIDADPPETRVRTPRRVRSRRFTVRIAGGDTERPKLKPSGIEKYNVYLATDGSERFKLIRSTPRRSFAFRARPGHRYAFYSRAIDRAGNVEPAPAKPDSVTRALRSRRR